jgi:hypothetical protein
MPRPRLSHNHNNLPRTTEYSLKMDHQNTSPADSAPKKSNGKPISDTQASQTKTQETRTFYTHRKTLVQSFENHSLTIQTNPRLRSQIQISLHHHAKFLESLRSTHNSKLTRCATRRIRRILLSIRKARRMLDEGLFWEASAALALISMHVGRLRLVGVKDCFADQMDGQARELHGRYAWKRDGDPAFFYRLHSMSVLMGFTDSCGCGCDYCRR